jgi:hypothetical protein
MRAQEAYVTAVTQSPYVLYFLERHFEVFPSPHRSPSPLILELAEQVAKRFAAEVEFERERMILRKECEFRYRQFPRCTDRDWNHFCAQSLDYDRGDVFVMVGRVVMERLMRSLVRARAAFPDLVQAITAGAGENLDPVGATYD